MKRAYWAMGLLAAGFFAGPASADGYPAVSLFSGNKTVAGEEIAWPACGKANVNAMLVTIAPGEKTELHRHGVLLFVYVLEGDLTVDYAEQRSSGAGHRPIIILGSVRENIPS